MRPLLLVFAILSVTVPAAAQGAKWDSLPDRLESRVRDRVPRARDRIVSRWRTRGHGVHLRVGSDYRLPPDAAVTEPIVVIGGSATVDGRAEDVVVVGGSLRVGPTAVVHGNTTVVGGDMAIDPLADVTGRVKNVAVAWPRLHLPSLRPFDAPWPQLVRAATMLRLGLTLLAGIVLTLIFPGSIRDVSARVAAAPGVSALVGVAGQVLFLPAFLVLAILLVITIVGIPLLAGLPVAMAACAVAWVAGFTGTAARVGAAFRGSVSSSPRVGDVVAGFLLLTGLTLGAEVLALVAPWLAPLSATLRVLGFAVEYLAWTIGLGAAIGALFGRRPVTTPRLPNFVPVQP